MVSPHGPSRPWPQFAPCLALHVAERGGQSADLIGQCPDLRLSQPTAAPIDKKKSRAPSLVIIAPSDP